MKDKKPLLLVTGSSGFIGAAVVQAFSVDHQVIGLDVKAPRTLPEDAVFIECDLTKPLSLESALMNIQRRFGEELASVIHLAAYYDFSGVPSPLYKTLTVDGTARLIKGLSRFQCEQFVFSSSLLVMKAAAPGELIDETWPLDPQWDYPRSKLAAEEVLREEHGAIPLVLLRIAGVYTDDCRSIPIAQQISRIYERKLESHFYPGDQTHGQAFIHLDDLVACLRAVVARRGELSSEEVFMIAEPDVVSYGELQDIIGHALWSEEWRTIRIPKSLAKAGAWAQGQMAETFIKPWMIDLADAHYPVDISRAAARLGFAPTYRLRTGLDEMLRRLKQDPRRWYRRNRLPFPEGRGEREAESHERPTPG